MYSSASWSVTYFVTYLSPALTPNASLFWSVQFYVLENTYDHSMILKLLFSIIGIRPHIILCEIWPETEKQFTRVIFNFQRTIILQHYGIASFDPLIILQTRFIFLEYNTVSSLFRDRSAANTKSNLDINFCVGCLVFRSYFASKFPWFTWMGSSNWM